MYELGPLLCRMTPLRSFVLLVVVCIHSLCVSLSLCLSLSLSLSLCLSLDVQICTFGSSRLFPDEFSLCLKSFVREKLHGSQDDSDTLLQV